MKQLTGVLRKYSQVEMGDRRLAPAGPRIDIDALRKDLQRVVARSDRFLWVWLSMLVLIFVLDCFVVLREMRNPRLVGSIFVATGVSLGAAIRQMRQLWREKFDTETLIALLPALGEGEVRKVILQLLGTLGKR